MSMNSLILKITNMLTNEYFSFFTAVQRNYWKYFQNTDVNIKSKNKYDTIKKSVFISHQNCYKMIHFIFYLFKKNIVELMK